jgi:hypothetical protein
MCRFRSSLVVRCLLASSSCAGSIHSQVGRFVPVIRGHDCGVSGFRSDVRAWHCRIPGRDRTVRWHVPEFRLDCRGAVGGDGGRSDGAVGTHANGTPRLTATWLHRVGIRRHGSHRLGSDGPFNARNMVAVLSVSRDLLRPWTNRGQSNLLALGWSEPGRVLCCGWHSDHGCGDCRHSPATRRNSGYRARRYRGGNAERKGFKVGNGFKCDCG